MTPEWEPQCPPEYVKTDVVGSLRLVARVFPESELDSTTFAYVSYVARYTKGSASLRVLFRGTAITATTLRTATIHTNPNYRY